MERIKRFFKEERGDAYITSIVICCGVIAISLFAAYTLFFTNLGTNLQGFTDSLGAWLAGSPPASS